MCQLNQGHIINSCFAVKIRMAENLLHFHALLCAVREGIIVFSHCNNIIARVYIKAYAIVRPLFTLLCAEAVCCCHYPLGVDESTATEVVHDVLTGVFVVVLLTDVGLPRPRPQFRHVACVYLIIIPGPGAGGWAIPRRQYS